MTGVPPSRTPTLTLACRPDLMPTPRIGRPYTLAADPEQPASPEAVMNQIRSIAIMLAALAADDIP